MRNRVKELLAAGKPAFGILSTIPSVAVVQILARSGYDWRLLDMEHGPIDLKSVQDMIVATAGTDAVPLVRVAWAHHWLAKPALDLGALGICFPMIRTRAEAETALRARRRHRGRPGAHGRGRADGAPAGEPPARAGGR